MTTEANSEANHESGEHSAEFLGYPISIGKLLFLTVITFGFYPVYWAYKNFKSLYPGKNMIALTYAVFIVWALFDLMKKFEEKSLQAGCAVKFPKILLAFAFFLLIMADRLCDRFLDAPYAISIVTELISLLPLVVVQRKINAVNRTLCPGKPFSTGYGIWQKIFIGLGGIVQLIAIVASLVVKTN